MILVTGSTGNVGAAVVRALLDRGEPVRAFARDLARVPPGAEVVVGDLDDRGSIERALAEADRVFLSSADGPRKVAHETAVIDAAADAGVELIVKITGVGSMPGSPLPAWDWNGRIEKRLEGSGIASSLVAASFFMTNLLASAPQVAATGSLVAPAGEGRVAMVDPRDAGAVGAALLAEGRAGERLVVSGPAAIGFDEVAAALKAATGRAVSYVDVPGEAARAALAEAGTPGWLIDQLVLLFERLREGQLAEVTTAVRDTLGREPRGFASFALEHAAAFGARPQVST